MYKNPIFGDNIPQKTIKSHPDIIFFQNSLKYSKYASIPPQYFPKKITPPPQVFQFHFPVAIATWGDGDGKITWGGGECGGIALGSRRRRRWQCRRCLRRGVRRGQNA